MRSGICGQTDWLTDKSHSLLRHSLKQGDATDIPNFSFPHLSVVSCVGLNVISKRQTGHGMPFHSAQFRVTLGALYSVPCPVELIQNIISANNCLSI